jgi:hypothetical protein
MSVVQVISAVRNVPRKYVTLLNTRGKRRGGEEEEKCEEGEEKAE